MNHRRLILQALLPAPLLWGMPPLAGAQVRDINDAINKAGRQRMLSQRAAKAYLALGQEVRSEQASKVLSESMALFDRQLVELKAFAPNAELRGTYEQLEKQWGSYKTALVGALPSKAGGETVMRAAAQVLALAHQGTVQLEQASGRQLARLVNLCGRQRMLSQRMASLYLAAGWGVDAMASATALAQARQEFLQAHALLKAAPEATPAIRSDLDMAEQQFTFFDTAVRNLAPGEAGARAKAEVFSSSERILQLMDGVTQQFSRIA